MVWEFWGGQGTVSCDHLSLVPLLPAPRPRPLFFKLGGIRRPLPHTLVSAFLPRPSSQLPHILPSPPPALRLPVTSGAAFTPVPAFRAPLLRLLHSLLSEDAPDPTLRPDARERSRGLRTAPPAR